MNTQRIRDPVHDLIKFSPGSEDDKVLWALVQTEPMQRLRRIRQLGFSDFVYPGASHSRFSHALGAMQMARRMLNVLDKTAAFSSIEDSDNPLWRRATLCAALLHDVGHGPYSHVFEEISRQLGISGGHEDATKKIIEETTISEILRSEQLGGGEQLFRKTLSFFKEEPGNNPYFQIVSSQLDADRLDFLTRDRYFTGAGAGDVDLEWLFDNFEIHYLPVELGSDAKQYTFTVKEKGLQALENYLLAYYQMYLTVYFHKTTRAVQLMVGNLLKQVFGEDPIDRQRYAGPLADYLIGESSGNLSSLLDTDDNSIQSVIRSASVSTIPSISNLAKRILRRDLYKCFEPPKELGGDQPIQKVTEFRRVLRQSGISWFQDRVQPKAYKEYGWIDEGFLQNLIVMTDSGPIRVSKLSSVVEGIPVRPVVRFYFDTSELRQEAIEIWNRL